MDQRDDHQRDNKSTVLLGVRIDRELHRRLKAKAARDGETLTAVVTAMVQRHVEEG